MRCEAQVTRTSESELLKDGLLFLREMSFKHSSGPLESDHI